eukprot:COSAG04_NODE_7456_length_1126_cov_1.154820_1_plen_338_part_01
MSSLGVRSHSLHTRHIVQSLLLRRESEGWAHWSGPSCAGGEGFTAAQQNTRHRLSCEYLGEKVMHPRQIPSAYKKQKREADLERQSHGEVHFAGRLWTDDADGSPHMKPLSVEGIDEDIAGTSGPDRTNRRRFLQRLQPWAKVEVDSSEDDDESSDEAEDAGVVCQDLSIAELVNALRKREGDIAPRLMLGVEREILTEDGKVRRWARFLDPRALAVQWVLLHALHIPGTGDTTIKLAMEPWLDGTTIGGKSCVGGTLTFRPIDCDVGDDQHIKPRVCMYADNTRETREVYELLVRILSMQMFTATESDLQINTGTRRITVQLQAEAVRGDYHAQQAW